MKRKIVELRRNARLEAEALIARVSEPTNEAAPEFAELIAALPMIFESALGYLLSEFDYEANSDSNTAIAVRLLATSAERFQRVKARALA